MAASPILERTETSIEFRVDDVAPATRPLPTASPGAIVQEVTHLRPEAVSELVQPLVPALQHGLIATVRSAFLDHRPLVLTPDAVWQAIAQGFADHVNAHPERLRERLVPHLGKKRLTVRMDYLEGSPENEWGPVMEDLAGLVRENALPAATALLDVSFSTTGPVERVARAIALLDTYQAYFEYEVVCICGIPSVRLEGTPDDWELIASRLEGLAAFDLEWWVASLRPVVRELAATARGVVNRDFWRAIFQTRDEHGGYGGPTTMVSGWIVRFAPYLGEAPERRPNELVQGRAREVPQRMLPSGIAQVPFRLRQDEQTAEMFAFAGVFGMQQDPRSLALRPRILWAVARAPERMLHLSPPGF